MCVLSGLLDYFRALLRGSFGMPVEGGEEVFQAVLGRCRTVIHARQAHLHTVCTRVSVCV